MGGVVHVRELVPTTCTLIGPQRSSCPAFLIGVALLRLASQALKPRHCIMFRHILAHVPIWAASGGSNEIHVTGGMQAGFYGHRWGTLPPTLVAEL